MSENRWPTYIDEETIRHFSQLNPVRSTLAISTNWLVICLTIWIMHHYFNPLLYILAIMVIGARQHALGILAHDAAHYRVYKNKLLNDLVGCLLLTWPIYFDFHAYRRRHYDHHRYLNTPKDPDHAKDIKFPLKKYYLLYPLAIPFGFGVYLLLKNIYLINKHSLNFFNKNISIYENRYKILFIFYSIVLYSVITYFKLWESYILFWLIPAALWGAFVSTIRSITEHYGIYDKPLHMRTRITYPNLFESLFITAHNINYHFIHHVYPTVPWYNLKKLHKLLLKNEKYRNDINISYGFWAAVKELFYKPTSDMQIKQ